MSLFTPVLKKNALDSSNDIGLIYKGRYDFLLLADNDIILVNSKSCVLFLILLIVPHLNSKPHDFIFVATETGSLDNISTRYV